MRQNEVPWKGLEYKNPSFLDPNDGKELSGVTVSAR